MVEFNFDGPNFAVGFASGIASTIAAYRAWEALKRLNTGGERAVVRTYASREADRGYILQLVEYARRQHLLGHKISLSNILIEPRFIEPPPLVEFPNPDEPIEDIFSTVPRVQDYPYLHQPYHMPTVGIERLGNGNKALTLIGVPGSGRTTALLAIAMWSAGYLEFVEPPDEIRQNFEDEDEKISFDEKLRRARNRMETHAGGNQPEQEDDQQGEHKPRLREIAPLYAHLCDVILTSGEYGRNVDPAEPLIRAVQQQAGWLASKRLVSKSYKLLEEGSALVLIDGYDDLPPADRPAAIRWLKALLTIYEGNNFIIAMPPQSYGLLMSVGAMPVYLRPWHDLDVTDSVAVLRDRWEDEIGSQPITIDSEVYRSPDEYFADVKKLARQQSALDTTLTIWTTYQGEVVNESDQMMMYLRHRLPKLEDMLPDLEKLAALQLDDGYITVSRFVDVVLGEDTAKSPQTQPASLQADKSDEGDTDALSEFFNEMDEPVSEEDRAQITQAVADANEDARATGAVPDDDAKESPQRRSISREKTGLIRRLLKAGVLISYRAGRFQFRHRLMAAYLAARALVDASEDEVIRHYENPNWEHAINYLSQMRDIDFLVAQELAKPLDVLHNPPLRLTTWLRYGGSEVSWRANMLKYLGSIMLAQHQYTLVRERVAAALASTRDEGATVIFRRAMRSQNPDVRRLGCLGAGVVSDLGALDALTQIAQQDPDDMIQVAATIALTAIDEEEALYTVADLLELSDNENVRRAIAESLTLNRNEGYQTIYEALSSDDIMMRRAASFALGRIRTEWAILALDDVYQNDGEWYVMSAAQGSMVRLYESQVKGLEAYPNATEAPWLQEWAEEQRELGNIPFDMEAEAIFEYAITQEEDPMVRLLATATVGQVNEYELIDQLYKVLQDRQEAIRDAAYRTLGQFQEGLGYRLPAPII